MSALRWSAPNLMEPKVTNPSFSSKSSLEAVNIKEAARRLSLCKNSVYNLIARGRLSRIDIGIKRRLILVSEIDAILAGER